MKKYSKLIYAVLILIIVILVIYIVKSNTQKNGKDEKEEIKEKTLSEIQQIENKFLNLFNQVNNIKFENYTISVLKEDKQDKSSNSESDNSSEKSDSSGKNSEKKGQGDSENSDSKTNQESSSQKNSDNKQYKLEEKGILTKDSETDWEQIKKDVEKIYTNLYSLTMDLYQVIQNQEDIVKFNKELDNLTQAVKDEDKESTLKELSTLYDYLPKFVENCTNQQKDIAVIKTKNNIFKAYSKLEKEEWESISNDINNASKDFKELITNMENETVNPYNVNKTNIIIDELKNAVNLKDKEVFLIKYKNLLEELEKI